ncbi:MAG: glycosyltransferase family 9 protein [Candidatus Obscuribacterales bacterium]|jgi:ADP-heptose:LPS heptosyltransferase
MDSSAQSFANIVIFHPAAIGDAVLATPVAATLRLNYPGAKITYWSHASLRPLLLGLCPSIDEFIDFHKELGFFELRKQLLAIQPDLFIDLSNSFRGEFLTSFTKIKALHYDKSDSNTPSQQHAVGNFMETIREISPETPPRLFPTLYPDAIAEKLVPQLVAAHNLPYGPLIGLVPGVGHLRPHRGWIFDGWVYLARYILDEYKHIPVLIGGPEDFELAQRINMEAGSRCINLCGQLQLDETAAILKCCDVVISGDTGPAHIAVAVGTPVIGLYGPTYPARSGPYGNFDQILDQNQACQCIGAKFCQLTGPGQPGECMGKIVLPEVLAKVRQAIAAESPSASRHDLSDSPPGVLFEPEVMRAMEEFEFMRSQRPTEVDEA